MTLRQGRFRLNFGLLNVPILATNTIQMFYLGYLDLAP